MVYSVIAYPAISAISWKRLGYPWPIWAQNNTSDLRKEPFLYENFLNIGNLVWSGFQF